MSYKSLNHPTHKESYVKRYNIYINNFTLYHKYYNEGKMSYYKNLFDDINNITINVKKTIEDILGDDILYIYDNDNNIIKFNIKIDDSLNKYFNFYGWYKIDEYNFKAKNKIIKNIDEYIKEKNNNDSKYTMHYNVNAFKTYETRQRIDFSFNYNENILNDYCHYNIDSIFKDLFEKEISIDAINTIEQIKKFYPDVIYNYDEQNNLIHIKRKRLNEWNKLLETLFKFYGWYPKDDRTLYPKYDIIDLNKYILDHKKVN